MQDKLFDDVIGVSRALYAAQCHAQRSPGLPGVGAMIAQGQAELFAACHRLVSHFDPAAEPPFDIPDPAPVEVVERAAPIVAQPEPEPEPAPEPEPETEVEPEFDADAVRAQIQKELAFFATRNLGAEIVRVLSANGVSRVGEASPLALPRILAGLQHAREELESIQ